MNKAALLYVADAIERHAVADLGFNMGTHVTPVVGNWQDHSGRYCGTTCCIAGWTVALLDENGCPRDSPLSVDQILKRQRTISADAQSSLGLDPFQARLFYFQASHRFLSEVTVAEAVAEMRRLAALPDDPQGGLR